MEKKKNNRRTFPRFDDRFKEVKCMTVRHRTVVQSALAGLWLLTANSPANAQSAAATKAAAVRGDAIDAAPPPAAAPAATKAASQAAGGVLNADFETLASFAFNVPNMTATNHISVSQAEKQIPAAIKQLDGKTVRIRGFMMPVKESQGKTTEFLITQSQPSCCFSGATQINEFVTVETPGKGFKIMMDAPITIQGTLHVGAVMDNGFMVGLYQLDGEKLIAPGD
jgi:hypothetical protein